MRQLWFERGDMNELLDFPRKILGIPLKFEWKAPFLIPRALRRSPIRGQEMTKWLHDALVEMDKGDAVAVGADVAAAGRATSSICS